MTNMVQRTISENTKGTATRAVLLLTAIVAALMLSSGAALAVTKTCETRVDCFGTSDPDTLKGTDDGNDFIYGRGGADTIKGFGEEAALDYLYGQGGPDKISDGSGPDALIGGAGNDELSGGVDFDYYFGSGWGDDSISDGAALPTWRPPSEGGRTRTHRSSTKTWSSSSYRAMARRYGPKAAPTLWSGKATPLTRCPAVQETIGSRVTSRPTS